MSDSGSAYVLDAFAVLCYVNREPGSVRIVEILRSAEAKRCTVSLCTVNWAEAMYWVLRRQGPEVAKDVADALDAAPIQILPADRALSARAAELKAPGGISLADCYAAALAQMLDATLVTGDPEFKRVANVVDIEWLPTTDE